MTVSISRGNSKMGSIPSVSLPSVKTCREGTKCSDGCYARKIERLRPSVKNAYQNNLDILESNPEVYWREVEAAIMVSRFFRFHVSGDIPDKEYFSNMVNVARRNPHCEILCFTKKYEIVNESLDVGVEIPRNLHIVFSAWRDMEMVNPYHLPEAHVRYKDGFTTASDDAIDCPGNCTECACTDDGCWVIESGQQVVFNYH